MEHLKELNNNLVLHHFAANRERRFYAFNRMLLDPVKKKKHNIILTVGYKPLAKSK